MAGGIFEHIVIPSLGTCGDIRSSAGVVGGGH